MSTAFPTGIPAFPTSVGTGLVAYSDGTGGLDFDAVLNFTPPASLGILEGPEILGIGHASFGSNARINNPSPIPFLSNIDWTAVIMLADAVEADEALPPGPFSIATGIANHIDFAPIQDATYAYHAYDSRLISRVGNTFLQGEVNLMFLQFLNFATGAFTNVEGITLSMGLGGDNDGTFCNLYGLHIQDFAGGGTTSKVSARGIQIETYTSTSTSLLSDYKAIEIFGATVGAGTRAWGIDIGNFSPSATGSTASKAVESAGGVWDLRANPLVYDSPIFHLRRPTTVTLVTTQKMIELTNNLDTIVSGFHYDWSYMPVTRTDAATVGNECIYFSSTQSFLAYRDSGGTIHNLQSGGSVTSVALALPAIFTVSGSPVTTTGTLTGTLATQTANTVWAGPTSGGAATPTFRSLVTADMPAGTGTVTSVDVSGGTTGLTFSGGPITTSGTITAAGTLIVDNGGSGRATATAYAVICGGTTATGAHQSIAGVGTSGQVLTSAGAGALPTFQTIVSGVSSVTSSDSSLTVSPTTGAVVAIINVAHANVWTALQSFTMASPTAPFGSGTKDERFGSGAGNNSATASSCTAFGFSALASMTSGDFNTALGDRTLTSNTSGNQNTALGGIALISNLTGNENVAVGFNTLSSNTTGEKNIALGTGALSANVSGGSNMAIGKSVLIACVSGSLNVGIGALALLAANSDENVAIGYFSLSVCTSGTGNVAIGSQAAKTTLTTGSSNTLLGTLSDTATSSTSHGVALGSSATCASNEAAFGPNINVQTGTVLSSTSTRRPRADFTDSNIDNTDATRKYRRVCNVWDTAAREAWSAAADGTRAKLSNPVGTSATNSRIGGTIFDYFTDVSTTSTDGTENDLYSSTLPANTFVENGDKVTAEYCVTDVASATATRRLQAYVAGTAVLDSGTQTFAAAGTCNVHLVIIRESSTVLRVKATLTVSGITFQPTVTYTRITGLTLTNTAIVKLTGIAAGVGAASGDIVAKIGTLCYLPSAT